MTTTRKPARAGPDALKAVCDAITGQDGTVEIAHPVTLPGRPVTVHLSAEEVCAYLKATGWKETPANTPLWRRFHVTRAAMSDSTVLVPVGDVHGTPGRLLFGTIERIADHERRHPLDVAEAIVARRGGKTCAGDDCGEWTQDADEALRLADAASPDWNVGGLDAGDGRSIIADGPIPLGHIRVSVMGSFGRDGSRSITPEQRDADARFIAAARVGWPRDANRVRLLCAEVERLRKGSKPEIDAAVEDLTRRERKRATRKGGA
jgi:hypothetical protein